MWTRRPSSTTDVWTASSRRTTLLCLRCSSTGLLACERSASSRLVRCSNFRRIADRVAGIPLKPMLAKPTKAITEVLDRFEGKKFTFEYKYDGERAQVHFLKDGSIKVFSRNSEDMSVKYPDLVEQLPRVRDSFLLFCARADEAQCIKEGTESFVIDCEAVAWDKDEKRLLPFQELSRRKRKDVSAEDIKVKVHLFAFDLLYLNGKVRLPPASPTSSV